MHKNLPYYIVNNPRFFLKSSLVYSLAATYVAVHFQAFKETDPDDVKGSLDSRRSNFRLSFDDFVNDAKLFIGRGHGGVVK